MKANEGEKFKSLLNGTEYIVKKIVNKWVVLESQDRAKQILTEVDTLAIKSFYQKKEDLSHGS